MNLTSVSLKITFFFSYELCLLTSHTSKRPMSTVKRLIRRICHASFLPSFCLSFCLSSFVPPIFPSVILFVTLPSSHLSVGHSVWQAIFLSVRHSLFLCAFEFVKLCSLIFLSVFLFAKLSFSLPFCL